MRTGDAEIVVDMLAGRCGEMGGAMEWRPPLAVTHPLHVDGIRKADWRRDIGWQTVLIILTDKFPVGGEMVLLPLRRRRYNEQSCKIYARKKYY